jgi:DNA-binding GntR family transcriptional regulator
MSKIAATLYQKVARRLTKQIVDGSRLVGSLLPTEPELAEQFAVSRQTVRSALRLLQDQGFIRRRKSIGTEIINAEPEASYQVSFDSLDSLVSVGASEIRSIQTVSAVTLDRQTARNLGAPVGDRWILFAGPRVHRASPKRAVGWSRIYIDAALSAITQAVQREPHVLVSSIIGREFGIEIRKIHQTVFAILADKPVSIALGIAEGQPCLRVVRQYKDSSNRLVEISETIYPGNRVSVSFDLLSQTRVR